MIDIDKVRRITEKNSTKDYSGYITVLNTAIYRAASNGENKIVLENSVNGLKLDNKIIYTLEKYYKNKGFNWIYDDSEYDHYDPNRSGIPFHEISW